MPLNSATTIITLVIKGSIFSGFPLKFAIERNNILKSKKDQEIFAFTSSDHAVYLSLFDRITVLSRQNITNTIYNIVTHQPCSHLAIEPVNSLLVASNEMEVCRIPYAYLSKVDDLESNQTVICFKVESTKRA